MKKVLKFLLFPLLIIGSVFVASAAEYVSLTINYSTVGTAEGYDHLTKMRVFFDGKEAGENTPKKQSIPNNVTVDIPKGTHKIKAILYAKNEGVWEERTLANNYSFDCIFEKTINLNGNNTLNLSFDFKELTVTEKTNKDNVNSTSISSSSTATSTNYKDALAKVNTFLKTFDNGYYGYLEIIDGYLYDRFPSGKYTKSLMTDLSKAEVETYNKKVRVLCKNNTDCVFSTYTDSYHKQLSFSQSSDFNTSELISLLNNLIESYNNKKTDKTTTTSSSTTVSNTSASPNLQTALTALNAYMKTFDGDRYKGMEVKDGYVYSNYSNNNYSKAKVEDLDYVKLNTEFKYIKLACKGDNKCVYSTITGNYHEYFNFQTSTGKDLNKMVGLLENFLAALKGKNTTSASTPNTAMSIREQKEKERQKENTTATDDDVDDYFGLFTDTPTSPTKSSTPASTTKSSTPNPAKYTKALNALNDYLKIFNSETYKGVEVKEGKVFFKFYVFGTTHNSSIPINDLTQNTTVIKGKSVGSVNSEEIKIFCKGDKECFYSTYNKSNADHFRFFSNSVKDLTKMKQLVEEFINALK